MVSWARVFGLDTGTMGVGVSCARRLYFTCMQTYTCWSCVNHHKGDGLLIVFLVGSRSMYVWIARSQES
jgi:hypothetical protein